MTWLSEIEENAQKLKEISRGLMFRKADADRLRMARVLREDSALIKKGIELIKIEQAHWSGCESSPEKYEELRYEAAQEFWKLFDNLSDDAKELIQNV